MGTGALFGNIDLAQITLYVFWAFFAGLLFYIRREDRREGYPLENDVTGRVENAGMIFIPPPKTFHLPHGGTAQAPDNKRETRPLALKRLGPWPGSPSEPTGNPLLDGVGPGAWAERADVPDLTAEGAAKIVPLRVAKDFHIAAQDPSPIGYRVIGADRKQAGVVTGVWVDKSESVLRFYEVETGPTDARRVVLLPVNFASVDKRHERIYVHAILSTQFVHVPATKSAEQITLLEEEKIYGYYGGGQLYATARRAEPML